MRCCWLVLVGFMLPYYSTPRSIWRFLLRLRPLLLLLLRVHHHHLLPHHFNEVFHQSKAELRTFWAWLNEPFHPNPSATASSLPSPSWQNWVWEDRFSLLQLRAIRIFMSKGRSPGSGLGRNRGGKWGCCAALRQFCSGDPLMIGFWEYCLMRILEWSPWMMLCVALLFHDIDSLPTFLTYGLLFGTVYGVPIPRNMKLGLIVTIVGGYFAFMRIIDVREEMMMRVS